METLGVIKLSCEITMKNISHPDLTIVVKFLKMNL